MIHVISESFQETPRNKGNQTDARNFISREMTWYDMLSQYFVNSTRSHRNLTHTFVAENYGTDQIPEMNAVRSYCCVISTCSFIACLSNRISFCYRIPRVPEKWHRMRSSHSCRVHKLSEIWHAQMFIAEKKKNGYSQVVEMNGEATVVWFLHVASICSCMV